jgi:hypothetical protein
MTEPTMVRARSGKARPLFAAALAAVALTAAACSSSTSSSSNSDAGSSSNSAALAYAKCMRSHGVADFPDPNADGGFSAPDGMNPNSATYISANDACKSLDDSASPPAATASNTAKLLKYSECMRAHGIADFPDPNAQGHLDIKAGKNHPDMDPNNPAYIAADKACQADLPGGGG